MQLSIKKKEKPDYLWQRPQIAHPTLASKPNNEIPLHTSQNVYCEKDKKL